jgi:hypothetical protein
MVTIVVAVLAGVIYGNRRFDDIHRRIDDLRSDMNARFAGVDAWVDYLWGELREMQSLVQEALRSRAS